MQLRSIAAVVLAAGLVVAGNAQAAASKVKLACETDFQKLCASASDGTKRGAVMRCVKTRLDQVSPDCQTAVKAAQAQTAARKAARTAKKA
ncbi:MAG TPA: hypothetical protein VII73_04890 [Caulobacteraceae bacterium]